MACQLWKRIRSTNLEQSWKGTRKENKSNFLPKIVWGSKLVARGWGEWLANTELWRPRMAQSASCHCLISAPSSQTETEANESNPTQNIPYKIAWYHNKPNQTKYSTAWYQPHQESGWQWQTKATRPRTYQTESYDTISNLTKPNMPLSVISPIMSQADSGRPYDSNLKQTKPYPTKNRGEPYYSKPNQSCQCIYPTLPFQTKPNQAKYQGRHFSKVPFMVKGAA